MAKQNPPIIAFNRGLVSPLALARVDLDRTRLSAEVMTNWLPKTQGAMIIRPGTKYRGSSINDTGAVFVEFVASTTDLALLEQTKNKMRVWLQDTGTISLLGRPLVTTTLSASDTGWTNASIGGIASTSAPKDQIPTMSAATTDSVTMSANVESTPAWHAGDDNVVTEWTDISGGGAPHWVMIDFGTGNTKKIKDHSIRALDVPLYGDSTPKDWLLQGNHTDTGWSDTGTTEVTVTGETGWSVSEKRRFQDTGWTDTGANAWQYWRLKITASNNPTQCGISEIELFEDSGAVAGGQVTQGAGGITLNAGSIGALAKATKQVVIGASDTGVEHSLAINVTRGPVTLRCGSTAGDDNHITETVLGTGYHNLAFTPYADFHVTLQSDKDYDRIVGSIAIGDSGTVEITTPWGADDLDNIRYDQSADVVYVDCKNVKPQKIERRGTGRSWSVVEYKPNLGPFLGKTSTARLNVAALSGNTTMSSDIPIFRSSNVGSLFRLTTDGQNGIFHLGNKYATTHSIKVTGIADTGATQTVDSERRITFDVTGTYSGTITIKRSFDDEEYGFHPITSDFVQSGANSDTGTFTTVIEDQDDNVIVWYRAEMTDWTSGAATVAITYPQGLSTSVVRVLGYNTNQSVDVEILTHVSDTGSTDDWEEGAWSDRRGYPQAVALHEGRLAHAGAANVWISVSDDYENFDDEVIGESASINRTLGSGPVDTINSLLSLSRLVAGTVGAEIVIKSSSLDEPLTSTNANSREFSTQGSSGLRSVTIDSRGVFVQRSKQRVYSVSFGEALATAGEYESTDLTVLVPELLKAGVVSIAVQRQPDTRIHCVLADGKVGIMTFEPAEEVLAWTLWETDGTVERAMVLPGVNEDKVFYHINRTIDGSTKRYLEQWAMESECQGDTGLSWLADCAASYTDTGRNDLIPGFAHLAGENVIAWGSDSGQTNAGKDLSPDDTGMTQTTYYVNTASDTGDTGKIFLSESVHHAVAGLPYMADYKSTKLAYAAQMGTALGQLKRGDKVAFILHQVHNAGLYFGSDTGHLDPLPRTTDADTGGEVDANKIFASFDRIAMPFPGSWDTDSRLYLRGKAPRPVTVMGAIPTVVTNER